MALFGLKPLSKKRTLPAPETDYRAATRVGQFRVGEKAIYFPVFPGTGYLPYAAMTRAWVKPTALSLTGTCGKELPMFRLRCFYEDEFYQDFLFEKESQARTALDAILKENPGIPRE